MNCKILISLLLIFLSLGGCNSQPLSMSKKTNYGLYKYSVHDTAVINDLIRICNLKLPRISNDLKIPINNETLIEIYPDQAEYDNHIMNTDLKGSPAISGDGKIQLVSPISKIKIDTISYPNRLLFIIHEHVHLLLDQIDIPPPIFLDEGLACYYGSYDFYTAIAGKYVKQINFIPTIDQLQNHYNEIPAPDLFSFLFVDFIMQTDSTPISTIIRKTSNLTLKNSKWIQYVKDKYY